MQPLRPYEKFDTLQQFLDHDQHVLRFYCQWDDTNNMFGDVRQMVLHYYLADDTIEIREVRPERCSMTIHCWTLKIDGYIWFWVKVTKELMVQVVMFKNINFEMAACTLTTSLERWPFKLNIYFKIYCVNSHSINVSFIQPFM